MDRGLLWTVFLWVIFCIVWFGRKWIKEKRKEVNYIDVFESVKPECNLVERDRTKHFNGRFKW